MRTERQKVSNASCSQEEWTIKRNEFTMKMKSVTWYLTLEFRSFFWRIVETIFNSYRLNN